MRAMRRNFPTTYIHFHLYGRKDALVFLVRRLRIEHILILEEDDGWFGIIANGT
jgi:hypothetical protein